jgi:hypothetical protein
MKLFGNAINFYGGIGECNHKTFVKHTGANTQKRISTFTSQVAQRYYKTLILHISKKSLNGSIGNNFNDESIINGTGVELSSKQIMAGQYQLTIVGWDEFGTFTDHKVIGNVKLPLVYICAVSTFASSTHFKHCGRLSIAGYTSCKMNINTKDATLQATSNYGDDGQWYDWCLVEWADHNEQPNTYPGKILAFFNMDNTIYAVIQSLIILITMEQLIDKFVCSFVLDHHRRTEIVKIDTIRTTLCIFKNYGGPLNLYFCVLPKRNWGQYFGEKNQFQDHHFLICCVKHHSDFTLHSNM